MSRECNFKDVTAVQHQEECICYAFVIGIFSSIIRQRLLKRDELPLKDAIDTALALEAAQRNADQCQSSLYVDAITALTKTERSPSGLNTAAVSTQQRKDIRHTCFFSGGSQHPRKNCTVREV